MKQTEEAPIYFERQKSFSSLCAVHAINNLLGGNSCSEKQMNEICYSLSDDWINPHKHLFGGDYDANIIMVALQILGYECKWVDSRNVQAISESCQIYDQRRIGYILNRKQKASGLKKLFGLSNRHWIAVKLHEGEYYELDSQQEQKQDKPKLIKNIDTFFQIELSEDSHIFQVYSTRK